MSEYTPITGELRGAMRQWGWVESDGSITFVSSPMPPSIDAEQSLAITGSDFDRLCDAIDAVHAQLERENAALKAELDRVLGEQEDKALTYEEAKQLCMKAFDGGATYGSESMRYGVNARAYDWEHWLEKHESLFKPTDTWERIIEDACRRAVDGYPDETGHIAMTDLVARCKALCERTKEDE